MPKAVRADYPVPLHGRIQVTERYDNSALPALLTNYHVLAFPSLSEGAALTPVEAMACGLVPVVSAAPGAHEAVTDGVSGLITPAGDGSSIGHRRHQAVARCRLVARVARRRPASLRGFRLAGHRRADRFGLSRRCRQIRHEPVASVEILA